MSMMGIEATAHDIAMRNSNGVPPVATPYDFLCRGTSAQRLSSNGAQESMGMDGLKGQKQLAQGTPWVYIKRSQRPTGAKALSPG